MPLTQSQVNTEIQGRRSISPVEEAFVSGDKKYPARVIVDENGDVVGIGSNPMYVTTPAGAGSINVTTREGSVVTASYDMRGWLMTSDAVLYAKGANGETLGNYGVESDDPPAI